MVTAPPKPPPPVPPPANSPKAAAVGSPAKEFKIQSGTITVPQKVVLYGPGGVGKTELSSLLETVGIKPLILDIENGSAYLNVHRIGDILTWDDLRSLLHDESLWSGFGAVVIDSFTKAEELAAQWVVKNIPHEKGHTISGIEDYGFGKGYVHIYETFLQLLGDLDAQARRGRTVVSICHDCTANVPNPAGEDWLRYEPRLQSPASGKSSIRHRVKEWCDHLLYVGYDVMTNKDGKGVGSGTRTIYTTEMPTHWAKSRCLSNPIPYTKGSAELWNQLLKR